MTGLSLLLVAAASGFDGGAALGHARALAALGPHPFGSPRAQAAASYVAASLRQAGIEQVRLSSFASDGRSGQNVIGVLRGAGPEFLVIGAHHDSAPDAAGAGDVHDDGGGVAVLIEAARLLARSEERPRTLVFASFDGGEYRSQAGEQAVGARAYVKSLGSEARSLVAALAVEVRGGPGATPVLHAIAYPDPLRPGRPAIAPGWLVQRTLDGARTAGVPLAVGDPLLGLLYQPAVRAFRAGLFGDDIAFVQAGLPAVLLSDSPLTRLYSRSGPARETTDRLDGAALERMGRALQGALGELAAAPPSRERDADWYVALGRVFGLYALAVAALASLGPALSRARSARGRWPATLAHAAAFTAAFSWQPVPALFCFGVPNLLAPLVRSRLWLVGFLPALGLALAGVATLLREATAGGRLASGLWLPSWQLAAFAAAAATLVLLRRPAAAGPGRKAARGKRKRK